MNRAARRLALLALPLAVLVAVSGAPAYSTERAVDRAAAAPHGASPAVVVCTKTWDGPPSGPLATWHTPANWSPDGVPGVGDGACIPAGNTVMYTFSSGTSTAGGVQNAGTLQVTGGSLTAASVENPARFRSAAERFRQGGSRAAGRSSSAAPARSR